MKKLFFIILLAIFAGGASAQCPMCKTALKSSQNGKSDVGNGINKGILFLLAAPYVLIGTVGIVWYKNRIRK